MRPKQRPLDENIQGEWVSLIDRSNKKIFKKDNWWKPKRSLKLQGRQNKKFSCLQKRKDW